MRRTLYVSVLRAQIEEGNAGRQALPIRACWGDSGHPMYLANLEITEPKHITRVSVRYNKAAPWRGAKVWLEIEVEDNLPTSADLEVR